jgi:hypothetical protein
MGTMSQEEPIYDPPFLEGASSYYGFFDVQVIEWILANIEDRDPKAKDMFLAR